MAEIITCTPKSLPRNLWVPAAQKAVEINPLNHAPLERLATRDALLTAAFPAKGTGHQRWHC
jgi:hypothetical protein